MVAPVLDAGGVEKVAPQGQCAFVVLKRITVSGEGLANL